MCFYLCFTLIISIYITCGFIFFNWHSTSRIPNEELKNKISNYIIQNIGAEICYKAYSFNSTFFSNKSDCLFESFKNTYYNYDYRYFKLKKEHFQFRENIKHNINLIKEYLKITELAAYIDSDTLRITADSYVNVNSKLFTVIKPRKYSINDDQITTCLVNHKLYYPNKIHEIIFRNSITKDTISDKRISVIY